MSGPTSIEWSERSWNPLRGCSRISPGCENCYAERIAARFSDRGRPFYDYATRTSTGARWTRKVDLVEEHLTDPVRWRKPARIFVNSMSDLFHESVEDDAIDRIFGVMAACQYLGPSARPGHKFQILTKRAERMRDYLAKDRRALWARHAAQLGGGDDPDGIFDQTLYGPQALPHVWLGVSVEDQARADERIPLLLETRAAVRFLSMEPLLERVQIDHWLRGRILRTLDGRWLHNTAAHVEAEAGTWELGLNWIIVGGESGPNARPCALEWIEEVVAQCRHRKIPVFVKQCGACVVSEERRDFDGKWAWRAGLRSRKGADPQEWPAHLRVREFPRPM